VEGFLIFAASSFLLAGLVALIEGKLHLLGSGKDKKASLF
jgi:hypothetical protein